MNRLSQIFWLALACLFFEPQVRAAFIDIRVSYKIVLNPADGKRPVGATDEAIDQGIVGANQLLAATFRGYRLVRVDPIREIGGLNEKDARQWYSVNFFDTTPVNGTTQGRVWKDAMQDAAILNSSIYLWNFKALNIYVTSGICGGICSALGQEDYIVIIGACSASSGSIQLHEIGHFFGLYHTQGKLCNGCGTGAGQCMTPGDDEIPDTLPDLQCWDPDQIARNWTAGRVGGPSNYAGLSPNDKVMVDNTFFNLMSYHTNQARLTELQLDRWAFSAYSPRIETVSGRTWFVAPGGSPLQDGTPFRPLQSVISATIEASSRDIVQIRPGIYHETGDLKTPLTLRATVAGPATIGK